MVDNVGDFEGLPAEGAVARLIKAARRAGVPVIAETDTVTAASAWQIYSELKTARAGIVLQPEETDGLSLFRTPFPTGHPQRLPTRPRPARRRRPGHPGAGGLPAPARHPFRQQGNSTMTRINLPSHRRSSRAGLVGLGVVVGCVLVAGCTSTADRPSTAVPTVSATADPTPSPSASAAIQEAPTSDAEAVSAAQDVVADFFAQRIVVNTAGGSEPASLEQVATGPALQLVTADAAEIAESKTVVTGTITFAQTSAYSVDLTGSDGQVHPFSAVNVSGCQDASSYQRTNEDGSAQMMPPDGSSVLDLSVIFEPTLSAWLVYDIIATGEDC